METAASENRQIADWLQQAADLLAAQGVERLERFIAASQDR